MAEKRIYAERAETIKRAVVKRRRKVKEMAVEYLGGRCQVCGYNCCPKALDVHHRDPKRKSFGIAAKGYTRSWEAIKREFNECVLICANCHREVHAGITQLSVEMPE